MNKFALAIEYAGTNYSGWQSQPTRNTIQDKLEYALMQICSEPIRTYAAGRTDAHTHATCQIVHFSAPEKLSIMQPSKWMQAINHFLPADIRLVWCKRVDHTFHARYSAHYRVYQYLLINRQANGGLLNKRVAYYHRPLHLPSMQAATTSLHGVHDFFQYRIADCTARTTIRHVYHSHIEQIGQFLVFSIVANGFLHRMVRLLMSDLIAVGTGRQSSDFLMRKLAGESLRNPMGCIGAEGLYFCGAMYNDLFKLPLSICSSPLLGEYSWPFSFK